MYEISPVAAGADKLNILLVEDDDEVRSCTAEMIHDLGHAVVEARSAEEAMTLLLQGTPADVLVADVGLPGMSGDLFAAEARSIRPTISVVFATGSDRIGEGERDSADPVLLRKPYDIVDLEAALAATRAGG